MNIYFVIPYFLGNQLDYMSGQGYEEYIVCSPSDEIASYARNHRFSYKEIPIIRNISVIKDMSSLFKIITYIYTIRPDIIVGHTPKGALLGMIAGRLTGVKKRFYFRHGLVFETSTGLKRKLLVLMDRLTAFLATKVVNVSNSVAIKSLKEGLNKEDKQTLLSKGTCNGVNIEKFSVVNVFSEKLYIYKKRLKIPENTYVIGYTGRLVKDKGIIQLIEAFQLLKESNSNIYLLLVGMLEERDGLPTHLRKMIIEDPNIIHTGYVSYNEIEYYYGLMDIFVLPSYREGFPTSVLEASSMKLPVLTTRETGCIDSIIEQQTGYFINHEKNDIAQKILYFIKNKNIAKEIGENGRSFVKKNFDEKKIWKEIIKLYEE